jgi:hypothetical protein
MLYFDRFEIPEGGRLFVYNPKRTQLLGAFTSVNNNRWSTFATGLIYGDEVTLEYNAPEGLKMPDLHLSEVGHAYRGVAAPDRGETGFGGSGKCQVNVNCEEGNNWGLQKRSVTRIAVKRGAASVWCTGSLVNNVRNDGTPYVLTADHCGKYSSETDLTQWVFYFNYESPGCPDPPLEPALASLTGATLVAHGGNAAASGSDFFLVLLGTPVPESYNAYFNGWSREMITSSISGVSIHHPQGDIKKISTYTTPLEPAVWKGGSKLAHWLVKWSQTPNGHGTTEGGSSGSPLFDTEGRLIGTLTGGDSSCDSAYLESPDWYGMFSYSWDKNGTDSVSVLKYWLDPDSTNIMSLNGWALSVGESASNDRIVLYPNPVADFLMIKPIGANIQTMSVTLTDLWGRRYYSHTFKDQPATEVRIDMRAFLPGMYIVSMTEGDRRFVRKVVKQ